MIYLPKKSTLSQHSAFIYSKVSDLPDINITSNREACITGTKGVTEYTRDLIRLDCGHINLTIKGKHLNMTALSIAEVIIKGELLSVEFSYCKR